MCTFTRFMKGKLINNKRADTTIGADNNTRIFDVGIPSVGFWAVIGGEFPNVKMDKLMSKLEISVKFGPAYSPSSNRLQVLLSRRC